MATPGLLQASDQKTKERGFRSGLSLGFDDLAAAVEAVGADVVTQMRFASGGLHCGARCGEGIVRTMHAALGRRFLVLLNGHGGSFEVRFRL